MGVKKYTGEEEKSPVCDVGADDCNLTELDSHMDNGQAHRSPLKHTARC